MISGLLSFTSCLTSHTELICCLWFPLLWGRDLICLFSAAVGRHLNTCRSVFIWTLGKTLFTSCQCVSVSEDICLLRPDVSRTSQVTWLSNLICCGFIFRLLFHRSDRCSALLVIVTAQLDVNSAQLLLRLCCSFPLLLRVLFGLLKVFFATQTKDFMTQNRKGGKMFQTHYEHWKVLFLSEGFMQMQRKRKTKKSEFSHDYNWKFKAIARHFYKYKHFHSY